MMKTNILIIDAGPAGSFAVFEAGLLKLILCGFHQATLMCQSAYKRIFPDKRYTTIAAIKGFDGSKKEAPKSVVKVIE